MVKVAVGAVEPAPNGTPFPLSLRASALAAVASGFLYFLSFPGVDAWPLAFVALVPLRLSLLGQAPRRAFFLGWLTGLTLTCFGFYWLVGMLQRFSGFPLPVCVFFALVVNGFQGCRMGVFAWSFVRAEERGWPPGIIWVLALPAAELTFPALFWWSFGASLHPANALTQIAELGGILGVCAVATAANWGFAEWARAALERRRIPFRATAPYWLAPLAAAVYGAVRIPALDRASAAAPHSVVGLVQANLGLMAKRLNHAESLRRHLRATAELVTRDKAALVLWSETVVTRQLQLPGAGELGQRAVAADVGVPLLFGALLRYPVPDARRFAYTNSALIADAHGTVEGRYDKQELVAFSEKMPFGRELPWLYEISPNSGKFEPTERVSPVPFGTHRIAVTICNDDVNTRATRRVVSEPGTDLIVNLTNDAWFGDTTEPWIHLALAKFRAIEHRRYFVRATNSGVSAFIDPVGRVFAKTETFHETTLARSVAWLDGRTLYDFIGDVPYWLGGAFVAFAAFRARRPR
jgi:apolipoprotein N-acyltransferase